jgi:hypothetical protein
VRTELIETLAGVETILSGACDTLPLERLLYCAGGSEPL